MVGDEMSEKMVAVGFRHTGKLTAQVLKALLGALLKKGTYQLTSNKESLTKLTDGGRQVSGVEIEKSELAGFDKYAKKYHFSYSMKQETNDKESYLFMFQSKDWDKLDLVIRDYLKDQTIDHSSFVEKIEVAKDKAFHINQAKAQEKEQTKEHTKSKKKTKTVER